MIRINYLNPRMIIADEGKVLTNGEIYSPVVYLGADESVDNWSEVDLAEVPESEAEK